MYKLEFKKLNEKAFTPVRTHPGDAGVDLSYCGDDKIIIMPGQRKLVSTGISVKIKYGYVGLVHPRSGLALKHGITVLNAPGTIDHGYEGEVGVVLINHSDVPYVIMHGDRIAQLVIQVCELPRVVEVETVEAGTSRGAGGFGSTG